MRHLANRCLRRLLGHGSVEPLLVAIGFTFVLLSSYWPVVTTEYGYNDDYPALLDVNNHSYTPLSNNTIPQGRPGEGMLTWVACSMAGTIPNLRWVRLVTLLGFVCFCWVLYGVHRRAGASRLFSLTTSLLVGLVPGVAAFIVCWSSRFYAGFCAVGAVMAGELIWRSFDSHNGARRIASLLLAASVLLSVCLIYPPIMPFCLYAGFVFFIEGGLRDSRNFKALLKFMAVFLLVVGLYYILYRLIVSPFHGAGLTARGALAFHPLGKFTYLGRLLWSSVTSWAQFHGLWIQCVAAGVFLFLVVFWVHNTASTRWIHSVLLTGCLLATAVLSVLPVIVVRENDFEFRTQVPLQCLAVFVLMKGLSTVWQRGASALRDKTRVVPFLAMALSAGLVAAFACLAGHHTRIGIIEPNAREWRLLKETVARIEGDPRQVVFVSPEPAEMDKTVLGEFGIIASPAWWNTGAMITLLIEGEKCVHRGCPARIIKRNAITVLSAQGIHGTNPVVDAFGAIHGENVRLKQDPYWGHLRVLPSGWCASDWFGCFDITSFPWIRHSILGRLYCGGKENGEYHFLDENLGWISTSPDKFPNFVVMSTGALQCLSTTWGPRVDVYDYGSRTWRWIR